MPSNILNTDTMFPQFLSNESTEARLMEVLNYLYMLREQLIHTPRSRPDIGSSLGRITPTWAAIRPQWRKSTVSTAWPAPISRAGRDRPGGGAQHRHRDGHGGRALGGA